TAAMYPPIPLPVTAAAAAPSILHTPARHDAPPLYTANNSASDPTNVLAADLTITKSHSGDFYLGQIGASYTITAQNIGAGSTSGVVTVVDSLPASLVATSIGGSGWTCNPGTLTCTRSDLLAAGAVYPPITLVVNVL